MTLDGKRVVVSGRQLRHRLGDRPGGGARGAAVVIASSRRARVDEALATLPADAEGHALDLTDAAAVEALFGRIGAFDHLVFTAGETLMLGGITDTGIDAAQRFFALRYWGAFAAAKFGGPHLRPGGSITFTTGTAGRRPRPGWSLGASVCAAVEGLTRALAVELAPIRVNAVAPGLVKTPLWAGMGEADREGMYGSAAAGLPVGHAGEAAEIAASYLYLMPQSYGTGQVIVVDGGGSLV